MKYALTRETRNEITVISIHSKLGTAERLCNRRNLKENTRTDSGQAWYDVREYDPKADDPIGDTMR